MNFNYLLKEIKKTWNWIWHSDSFLSWIVALAVIFILIKFIFFPSLSFIMGTNLPLAGIESSSMDHQIIKDEKNKYGLCGNFYLKEDDYHINFNDYWNECGNWYEKNKISKDEFEKFPLKNGFRKGDIVIVWGRSDVKVGDVIIFKPNSESYAPRPIIHRIVNIKDNGIIQTKGDHNGQQLTISNNIYNTDETNISEDKVIGKAIIKIPYLGWPKIWLVETFNFIRTIFN